MKNGMCFFKILVVQSNSYDITFLSKIINLIKYQRAKLKPTNHTANHLLS